MQFFVWLRVPLKGEIDIKSGAAYMVLQRFQHVPNLNLVILLIAYLFGSLDAFVGKLKVCLRLSTIELPV